MISKCLEICATCGKKWRLIQYQKDPRSGRVHQVMLIWTVWRQTMITLSRGDGTLLVGSLLGIILQTVLHQLLQLCCSFICQFSRVNNILAKSKSNFKFRMPLKYRSTMAIPTIKTFPIIVEGILLNITCIWKVLEVANSSFCKSWS